MKYIRAFRLKGIKESFWNRPEETTTEYLSRIQAFFFDTEVPKFRAGQKEVVVGDIILAFTDEDCAHERGVTIDDDLRVYFPGEKETHFLQDLSGADMKTIWDAIVEHYPAEVEGSEMGFFGVKDRPKKEYKRQSPKMSPMLNPTRNFNPPHP